jgi:hypothetical protein
MAFMPRGRWDSMGLASTVTWNAVGENFTTSAAERYAGRVTVGGAVLLRKSGEGGGFLAEGEVGLFGATIAGNLECDAGFFLTLASGL